MKRTLPLLLALGVGALGGAALVHAQQPRAGIAADEARTRYALCVTRGDSVTCIDELRRDLGPAWNRVPADASDAAELLRVVCGEAGKDSALRRLQRQLAELTNLLSLEKGQGKRDRDELAALQATLATLRAENERLAAAKK